MNATDLAFTSAAELAREIAARRLSPVELLDVLLERIARLDPAIGAFVEVHADAARAEARERETEAVHGRTRGPLHGVPVALKDIFDVAGRRTAAGSRILAERVASRDAHVVECLKRAGALVFGRLNLHEFAFGITTTNPHFGTTRNPWRRDRVPGGSSGGSGAALASGLTPLSLGTDTGGSIRIPAGACGVVGLKPTFGSVGRRGVTPLSWSLDHVGPMTRDVRDAALLFGVIAAPDPEDEWCVTTSPRPIELDPEPDLRGLRIGVPRRYFYAGLDVEVERAVEAALDALRALGARTVDLDLTTLDHAYTAFHAILAVDAAAWHRPWLSTRAGEYGEDVRRGLEMGCLLPAVDYVDARRMQTLVRREFAAAFERVDVMVTPTLPRTAPPIGEAMSREPAEAWNRLVAPFNLSGVPALSLPCGFDTAGLPIGLHVAGRWFDEGAVLRVGLAYERATEWHRRRPPEV